MVAIQNAMVRNLVVLGLEQAKEAAPTLQEYLLRGKPGIDLRHSDGSLIDLHWAIQGYEIPPSDPEIIWSHCRQRETSEELPGWLWKERD